MKGQIMLLVVPPWMTEPVGYVVVILLGVEVMAPRAWIFTEDVWWRIALGNSTVGRQLRMEAKKDFHLSIMQRVIDGPTPHPLAVLQAIAARPFELMRLTRDLRAMKGDMIGEIFESAIRQLNAGWREGKAPEILYGYIKTIEDAADDPAIDEVTRLRGKCAISVVKYALGDLIGGNKIGAENYSKAWRLEPEGESELKWIASYGYFNSTLFLGDFRRAMKLMAKLWSGYYAPLDDSAKASLRERLSGHLILNPILAIPRHIILAAAFNEHPSFEPEYWPSAESYVRLTPKEQVCPIRWAEAWYEEAKRVCTTEPTSLSFSHAYAAFYFTLLLLEEGMPAAYLHEKINEAFEAIDDSAAIVARYTKYGFRGVYNLVCGDNEKALENLSQAATFSAISGNRFADAIFMCAHGVAAARLNRPSRYLEPDVNHYLAEANRLARKIKRPFYRKLFYGAQSAVCHLRGEKAKAHRYAEWSKHGEPGNRILKIFHGQDTHEDD
jgi:hypothetical protein